MVTIDIDHDRDLRSCATHGLTGARLPLGAPVEFQGQPEEFSATDLVATALGACLLGVFELLGRRRGVELTGTHAVVTKELAGTSPRRLASVHVHLDLPASVPVEQRPTLAQALAICPVHHSLHPDIVQTFELNWV